MPKESALLNTAPIPFFEQIMHKDSLRINGHTTLKEDNNAMTNKTGNLVETWIL